MIGVDTFSWYKLIRLRDEGWSELMIEILKTGAFFITHEVRREIEHHFPSEKRVFEFVIVLKTLNKGF